MDAKRTHALVAASMAGLLAAVVSGVTATAHAEDAGASGKVPCYGINKCKGTGECGGKAHSCAGQNECAGQGWLSLDKDSCLKIQDGRLTAEPEQG